MAFLTGKTAAIGLALASALALGGCYEDGYGYGGLSAGYGGYYDDGYYGGGYGPGGYYGGGYGYPSYGWYDGFYYPGTGFYVYDRGGSRHRWNDNARRYWEGRRNQAGNWRGRPGDGRPGDGRPGDGRPGDGRPGDGRPGRNDGQYGGRPGIPGDGQWSGRPGRGPDGQANGRPTRPDGGAWAGRPDRGPRPDRQRAERGQGTWGAMPQAQRPQAATPRAEQSFRNAQRGGGGNGRSGRGEARPQ